MKLLEELVAIRSASGDEGNMRDFLVDYVQSNKANWKVQPTLHFGDGFQDALVLIFGQPKTAIFAIVAVVIWRGVGYYMVIYLAGLQAIPADLYEAAAIDGSDGWQKHLDITIPLMKPYIILVAVISAIGAMKVFEEVYIMSQGGPANSTKTVVYYLYDKGFTSLEMGYASAIGVFLFLIIFIISILTFKFINPAKTI